MLQTIEVEIDAHGQIHPLEPLAFKLTGRALLTLLDQPTVHGDTLLRGSAEQALALLASPRFANRPFASPEEVRRRISAMRDEWDTPL